MKKNPGKQFWPELKESQNTMDLLQSESPHDVDELISVLSRDREGVNHVVDLLREISRRGSNALHIAAYILSNLEIMRKKNKDLDIMLAEVDCDKPLPAYMAEMGMLISKLDMYKLERIEMAIVYCHKLFGRDTLDMPLDEFLDDYR